METIVEDGIKSKEKLRKNLENRLIEFSIEVLKLSEEIINTRAGNHIASQFVRSGTSPAFNYGEAQSAESRADFLHKMKICLKELRETMVSLEIIYRKPLLPVNKLSSLTKIIKENDELISIFVASINTASQKKSTS